MERIQKTVFLSYRRTNFSWALNIFQDLTHHGYDVFIDYMSIASGDFERVIVENIKARAHFLVLLTPSALEHCHNPADWLRREIEMALDSQRNIVPLMLGGFDFATPQIATQLTGKLAEVARYNALPITPAFFFAAMERLRSRYLNVSLSAVLHPASVAARTAALEQKSAASAAPPVQEKELTAEQWFEKAFISSDLDEKLKFYTEAIRLKPDYVEAFNNRGAARGDNGDLDGALDDFTEAIRLKPDYAGAFNNRHIVREAKGDIYGALDDFAEWRRLQPHDAEVSTTEAVCFRTKSRPRQSRKAWKGQVATAGCQNNSHDLITYGQKWRLC